MTAPTDVRPCRVCGIADPAIMGRDRSHPSGHSSICRPCGAAEQRARRVIPPTPRDPMRVRPCSGCGTTDLASMVRNRNRPNGLATICRPCSAEAARRRRTDSEYRTRSLAALREVYAAKGDGRVLANREARVRYSARSEAEVAAARARLRPDGTKACRNCGEVLRLNAFGANRSAPDGLQSRCRPCDVAAWSLRQDRANRTRWQALGIDPDRCLYCLGPAQDVEHVLPRVLGGPDAGWNLVPACIPCNRGIGGKFDRPVVWWVLDRFADDATDVLARLFAVEGLDIQSPATRLDPAA